MISSKRIRFIDIAHAMNVHTFIIWEFIRRYGHEQDVRKDKYGQGDVSAAECRKWINKLYSYIREQDFTYKQDINKRQYLFRDMRKYAEEKQNERDVPREYSADKDGNIIRYSWMGASRTFGHIWKWNTATGGWDYVETTLLRKYTSRCASRLDKDVTLSYPIQDSDCDF